MKQTQCDVLDGRMGNIEIKLGKMHDDILIIKTERRMEKKQAGFIAAGVSLVISVIALFLRR